MAVQIARSGSKTKKRSGGVTVGSRFRTADTPAGSDTARKISNAETRITAAGGDPNIDTRNAFEKAVNLPQDQNWFLDFLELIGRPGAATTVAIDDWVQGRNRPLSEALWSGFAGHERTTGADIFKSQGYGPVSSGVLGFGLDVLTDPTMLIPGRAYTAVAGTVGKGAKTVGRAAMRIPGVEDTVKGAARILSQDAFRDPLLSKIVREHENARNYMQNTSFRNVFNQAVKNPKVAQDAQRILESDLQIRKSPEEYLDLILGHSRNNPYRVIGTGEQAEGFLRELNTVLRETPEMAEYIAKNEARAAKAREQLDNLLSGGGRERYQRILQLQEAGERLSRSDNAFFKKVTNAQRRVANLDNLMDDLLQGVRFIDNDIGAGRMLQTPAPHITRQAIQRNREHILRSMAPRKTFAEIATNPATRSVAQNLMRDGSVKVTDNSILSDLERLFGNDITRRGNTVRLKPNSEYHGERIDQATFAQPLEDVVFERPVRELPDRATPEGKAAYELADAIRKEQERLREFARERGVNINEVEGYLAHELTAEQKALRPLMTTSGVRKYGGNEKVYGQRKYDGSVEDVNEMLGKPLFEKDSVKSTLIKQHRTIDSVIATSLQREVVKNFGIRYREGMEIPKDHVLHMFDGKPYLISKDAEYAIRNVKDRLTEKGIETFLKGYDTALGWWKKMALFSVGYHVRNIIGSHFNMYIAGMSPTAIGRYVPQAVNDLRKLGKKDAPKLLDEFEKRGLGASTQAFSEFRYSGRDMEREIDRALRRATASPASRAIGAIPRALDISLDVAHQMDVVNKYAMFKWAVEKKGMSFDDAEKLVKQTLFDYNDLTVTERKAFRRIIPFYTWMRKNVEFQLRNVVQNPQRYRNISHLYDNAYSATETDKETTPEWLQESMALPIGQDLFANISAPPADLARAGDPISMLASSSAPFLKLPFELYGNYDTFRKKEIERFPGEATEFMGMDVSPKLAHVANQIGILRQLDAMFKDKPLVEKATGGFIRQNDPEQQAYFNELDRLRQLEALIQQLKQQGVHVPTMNELR